MRCFVPVSINLDESELVNTFVCGGINVPWISSWFLTYTLDNVFCYFENDVKYLEFWYVNRYFKGKDTNDYNNNRFTEIMDNIMDTRCMVFPHWFSDHWVMLFKLNDDFYFIDSLNKSIEVYSELSEFILYIRQLFVDISFEQLQVEQQNDSCSCGYRILLYSLMIYHSDIHPHLLSNIHFKQKYFSQIHSKEHLLQDILLQFLHKFEHSLQKVFEQFSHFEEQIKQGFLLQE